MSPPTIPNPHCPPPDDKNSWVRPALIAGLIAAPMAVAMVFGVIRIIAAQKKAAEQRTAWHKMASSANRMESDLKKNFDPQKGITNIDFTEFDKFREGFKNASHNLSGDDAIIAKAETAYMDRIQAAATNYQAAIKKLSSAHVLEKLDSSDKQQLEARRKIVEQFLEANSAFKQTILSSEDNIRIDLTVAQVPALKINSFMQGFHSATTYRNSLSIKIRDCDDRIGGAMLEILNLLDREWGHWKADPSVDTLKFESASALNAYKENLNVISLAGKEQVRLQTLLVNRPRSQQP